MRASYDSIDNKQKMCEKVNKDITFIQFFHSTRLHSTELFKTFFSLLTLQLLFLQKASWPGKNSQTSYKSFIFLVNFEIYITGLCTGNSLIFFHHGGNEKYLRVRSQ